MRKIWQIARKDLKLIIRDQMALVLYLLAPFLLTLGMAAITGAFSSGDTGLSNIPLVITNADKGDLGIALVEVFQSEGLDELINSILQTDFELARQLVDNRSAVAALLIPEGFSSSVIPQKGVSLPGNVSQLQLYTDGESTYSVGIIRAVLETFIYELDSSAASVSIPLDKLFSNGLISPEEVPVFLDSLLPKLMGSENGVGYQLIVNDSAAERQDVSLLALIAPGMALMFLMFNVTSGGVSFLLERRKFTLQRNLVSPTSSYQIILGKSFGIYLRGVAQVLILVLTSALLFGLNWGNWLAVLVLIAFVAYGALGWGMLLTSFFKTPSQVSNAGTTIALLFGMLGGGFLPMTALPEWLKTIARISPNAWGSEGFTILAAGGTLANLGSILLALLIMGTVLLILASFFFRRNVIQVGG
ncbi:MAG: ABC transporter permease [Chloroflexi bacterium]|nr:ABC transporter permease [Chloroflexota bacterium]